METNVLTFDNTGFVYDVANPTQQTEELAFILKNALLDTSPINIHQMDSEETATCISRTLAYIETPLAPAIDDVNDSLAPVATISDNAASIATSIATLTSIDNRMETLNTWVESMTMLISTINDNIAFVQTSLGYLEGFLDPENIPGYTIYDLIADLCAASGFFMDSPGKVTIEKIIPPEEP